MKLNFDSIPAELKSLPRWILWKLEYRDGKPTKVPYRIDGKRASATNPQDWVDFQTVRKTFDLTTVFGVGFVLTKEDGICCIDLDDAIDESGNICPEAMQIVEQMNSWTEISQSGRGLHIFVRGTKPTTRAKVTPKTFKALEVYDHARYIAITANHLQGTPLTVEARQPELNALCEKYFSPETHAPQSPEKPRCNDLSDEEIIALCRRAKNGDKFSRLFDYGDVSLYSGDESAADAALCAMLAFYTRDEHQIERLFSRSALARRAKWRERADYRHRTVQNALMQVREHYAPTNRTNELTGKYPIQTLITPTPADEFDESEAENFDMSFPESLVPQGIFGRLFDYYATLSDAPPQFHFVATLTTFSAIIGTHLKTKRRSVSVKAHDYYVILTSSGQGKSTALEPCRELLSALERRVINKPYAHIFLYPQVSTLRGLIDCARSESEREMREREAAERKNKSTLPPKQAQSSGALIVDEAAILFDAMRAEYNNGFDSLFLQLWDGAEKLFATSARNDGRIRVPESAITLLGASTVKKFRERLPRTAFEDGLVARLQICFSPKRETPRTPLTAIVPETDRSKENAMLNELLGFFQFVCEMQSKPIVDSDGARRLDAESVERWFEESQSYTNEAICAYYQRLDLRKLRLALLFSACETYDQHGQFGDGITISETAMAQAIKICEFFKQHTLHFIQQQSDATDERGLDQIGRAKLKILKLLRERFRGETKQRELFRFSNCGKTVFEAALNELIESGEVLIEQRANKNNRLVQYVVAKPRKPQKTSVNTYDTYDTYDTSKNNATETLPKRQNGSKCSVVTASVVSDFSSEPTASPEPTSPEPTVPETPKPESLPVPEPTVSPEPTVPEPLPELSETDLLARVLNELCQSWKNKKIPAAAIRQTLNAICGERANTIGRRLFPTHIWKLGETSFFIFVDNEFRPQGYRGLIDQNGDGVICPDPLPPHFE